MYKQTMQMTINTMTHPATIAAIHHGDNSRSAKHKTARPISEMNLAQCYFISIGKTLSYSSSYAVSK